MFTGKKIGKQVSDLVEKMCVVQEVCGSETEK